jgi:hypothetical protein
MAPDPEQARKAEQALQKIAGEWLSRPGVVSVEVARRRKGGVPTDEVAIRVTVRSKRPRAEIPDDELFPDSLDAIPVDIVEGQPPSPEGGTGTE